MNNIMTQQQADELEELWIAAFELDKFEDFSEPIAEFGEEHNSARRRLYDALVAMSENNQDAA